MFLVPGAANMFIFDTEEPKDDINNSNSSNSTELLCLCLKLALKQPLEIRTTKYDPNGQRNMLNWVPPLFSPFTTFFGGLDI